MDQSQHPPNDFKPIYTPLRQSRSEWLQIAFLALLTVAFLCIGAWAIWWLGSKLSVWI
jgi:hypothetical protein